MNHTYSKKNNFPLALSYDDISLVPQYSEINSRSLVDTSTILLNKNGTFLKLAAGFIASPMDSVCSGQMALALGKRGALGIIHRFMSEEDQVNQIKLLKQQGFVAAAAVGTKISDCSRIIKLISAGVDLICIDVAHAHHRMVKDIIQQIRNIEPTNDYKYVHIMAGTICTSEAADSLIEWGCDSIRVNVGAGSMCSTRIMTGFGIPQVTAIMNCCAVACPRGVSVIADGSIRFPGDAVKAFALGASAVMIGNLFAGTDESPGKLKRLGSFGEEIFVKTYRGSASLDSKVARGEEGKNIEGVSTLVPYRGSVDLVLDSLMDGLRSGMSYCGARTIQELQQKAKFVRVTNAGIIEASPHGLQRQVTKI